MARQAIKIRRDLAKKYDFEANNLDQMAIFAKRDDLKSTYEHLVNLRDQKKRFAQTARKMAGDL